MPAPCHKASLFGLASADLCNIDIVAAEEGSSLQSSRAWPFDVPETRQDAPLLHRRGVASARTRRAVVKGKRGGGLTTSCDARATYPYHHCHTSERRYPVLVKNRAWRRSAPLQKRWRDI